MSQAVQIVFEEWSYSCGEPSCCDDWGTRLVVNGEVVTSNAFTEPDELRAIFDAAGVAYEITVRREGGD